MTFAEWLKAERYAAATSRVTLARIEAMRREPDGLEGRLRRSEHDRDAARRYARYLETRERLEPFDRLVQSALAVPQPRRRLPKAPRVHEARSWSEDDWARLSRELERQREPEAIVILVIAATGLRVGDLLRLRKEALGRALAGNSTDVVTIQKGGHTRRLPVEGARAQWQLLLDRWTDGATVAAWLCPTTGWGSETPGGAYQRVRRHLQKTCKSLKLEGRPHLHRLRRTVAVRALEATRDVHLVQQLLGHSSLQSTQIYTDELRSREVAELQQRLLRGGSTDVQHTRTAATERHAQRPAAPGQRPAHR